MSWRVIKQRLRDQGGYTLIEMVSFLTIMTLLSGLVVANTHVGDQRQKLRDGVAQYLTAVKQAESAAVSSQVVGASDPQACNGATSCPRKAYGVCLLNTSAVGAGNKCVPTSTNRNSFQVYARDLRDTDTTKPPGQGCGAGVSCPPDIINSYMVNGVQWDLSHYVDYLPPTPKMLVNGLTTNPIRITVSVTNYTRCVYFRPVAGAVYSDICS